MTSIVNGKNRNQTRGFRNFTASTKVTEVELHELERAAAACGVRLGEWIRGVLLRKAKSSPNAIAVDHLMTEIVALQLFLTEALSSVACGERMSTEGYQQLMKNVKTNKDRAAREVIAKYVSGNEEERHV